MSQNNNIRLKIHTIKYEYTLSVLINYCELVNHFLNEGALYLETIIGVS